jgi:hypothetical protein
LGLLAQLRQRRYRRLGLALFAALVAHLGLVLSGNWGILLFSAPSNQDRVLTLTLENTTYEGLKDTSIEDQDTVNAAKLGEASGAPENADAKDEVQKPLKSIAMQIADKLPVIVPDLNRGVEQSNKPAGANASSAESSEERIVNSWSLPDAPKPIISQKYSDTKILLSSLQDVSEQAEDVASYETIDAQELEMITRKAIQWSSDVSENSEPREAEKWQQGDYQYSATFDKRSAENDMVTDEVRIEIATKRDGKKLTTSLRLKKMAFSNFAQFINHWDSSVSIHDDEMNGRFHSNTRINLLASKKAAPLFHGKVTTASYFVDISGGKAKKDIFLAGLETGVKRIAMPKPRTLFQEEQALKSLNSRIIEQDSRLVFTHDGYYLVQPRKKIGVMQRYPIGERPLYILAAPRVSLWLSGTVNGAVAVYSPERIVIEGSLEYLSIENIDQGGDFLGLISGRSVVVANRKIVPEGDLNIQAAIYAKNRFQVKQIGGRQAGTLNIYGSLSVGTITATEPRYATNIVFDTRLENNRPPGFPLTDRYELVAKAHHWQLTDEPFYEPIVDQAEETLDTTETAESGAAIKK